MRTSFGPALGLALLLAAPTAARAQQEFESPGLLEIGDELALLAEEDIVVSASRYAQRIEESPSAITVLTREDILASGYDDLADVMRLVPGVDVLRITPIQTAIGIRSGTTVSGDLTVVLIDGRDVRVHFFGQPVWSAMPVDVDSVERIEVIRGPASMLYGANAIQGVVNIVTREPSERPFAAEVATHAAGPQDFGADARVHGSRGELRWWVGGGFERGGPLEPVDGRPGASRARAMVGWRPGPGVDAVLEAGFFSVEGDHSTALGALASRFSWPHASARLEIGDTRIQLVAESNHLAGEMNSGLVMLGDTPEEDLTLARVGALEYESRSLELSGHHSLQLSAANRLVFGVSGRLVHHASENMVQCPDVPFDAFDPAACAPLSLHERRAGLFVQDEWRLHERVSVTAGVRFDVNSLHPEPGISPRAALVWRLLEGQALRLSAGRAYREPSFMESQAHVRLLPGDEGVPTDVLQRMRYIFATQVGNEALLNENAAVAEIGWRGRFFEGRLGATVDLFYSHHSDLIYGDMSDFELVPGFGGVPTLPDTARAGYVNSDEVLQAVGGEVAVRWRPTQWMELGVAYAADVPVGFDPEVPTGVTEGAAEPDHRVTASFRVSRAGGLRAGLDALWASAYLQQANDPRSVMAPRLTVGLGDMLMLNASVGWAGRLGSAELEAGVAGYNIVAPGRREAAGVDLASGLSAGALRLVTQPRVYLRGRF